MRRRLATLAAAALTVALLVPVASVSAASVIYVRPGQSIQAALNKAPAGALISVERGTYRGNLEIKRSVRLLGHDAILVPATKPTKNVCTLGFVNGVVGICVHGALNPDGSTVRSISKVSIEGFTVRNFSGPGIVAMGVAGFRAARNVTAHNGQMGMFIENVSDVSLLYNRSYGNGGDGIYLEGSPSANAVITGNVSYNNLGAGILFLNSLGGQIALNNLYGNCGGIAVVFVTTPVAEPSGDVSIQLNQVTANDRMCPDQSAYGGPPAYGGIGIALIGARNTDVALNDVRNNVAQTGSGISGGGIVLLDGVMFGVGAPTGNFIRLNWLSGNTPSDIYGDGTGSANTVSGNICAITNLTGAC